MEPVPRTGSRRSRLLVVGAALLVLVAIVAFASRSGFGSASTAPTKGFIDWAFSLFLVLFALMIPVAIYGFFFSGDRPVAQRERGFAAGVIRNLVIVGIVLLAVAGYFYLRHHHHLAGVHVPRFVGAGTAKGGTGSRHATRPPAFEWPVLLVGLGLVLATVAMWLSLRRQRKPYVRMDLGDESSRLLDDVAASISDALDDLEAEPDARRAVIAAYARMESVLARNGLRRAASETPLEYLQRVLLGLTSRGDAVRTLTGLFQEARFSTHAIDAGMKQAAISALSAIRNDLRAEPA